MPIIPLLQGSRPVANAPAPVLDRERRPTVDNRGVINAVGALGSVKMPELPQELADNSGLSAIGRAIGQAGNVLGALAIKRQEAETDIQVASADGRLQMERADFENWKINSNADPGTWEGEWSKRLNSVQTSLLEDEKLNPQAREAITLRLNRYVGQSTADVSMGATKETFARAKSAFVAQADNAIEAQDKDGFESALSTLQDRGYSFPHEIENMRQKFAQRGEQKTKEAKALEERAEVEAVRAQAIADPLKWKAENPTPWEGKEILWQTARNAADSREREGSADAIEQITSAIATGDLTVPAEVDAWESPFLTPQIREQAKRYIASRNEVAERMDRETNGVRNAVELRQRVKAYDPANDPERKEYFELVREVGTRVEQSMAGEITGELYRKYGTEPPKLKARPELEQNVSKSLDTIFDAKQGAIPWRKEVPVMDAKGRPVLDYNGNPKTELKEDLAAKQRALDAQTQIEIRMGDWFKENPDATLPEVKKKLNEFLPEGTRAGVLDMLQKKRAAGVPTAGKVTSYGYSNDLTPDRNSSAGIGAFVPSDEQAKIKAGLPSEYRLQKGDIAVSPDVEKQFKASGVKPGDNVLVELANGTTRLARWMDRTAQDEQILRGDIKGVTKPLRGRFDFYNPEGKDPLDGVAVVGWKPVQSVASR